MNERTIMNEWTLNSRLAYIALRFRASISLIHREIYDDVVSVLWNLKRSVAQII